jgi:hypothetical protein
MKPKTLDKKATKIFEKIIGRVPEGQRYLRIGERGGAFMPLSVERLYACSLGTIYSFTHYYYQNGDPCRDPEMCFLKTQTGDIFSITFEQSIPPIHQESMIYQGGGWKLKPRLQQEHTEFANQWLRNIEWQQEL